jgi:hypothetical protein
MAVMPLVGPVPSLMNRLQRDRAVAAALLNKSAEALAMTRAANGRARCARGNAGASYPNGGAVEPRRSADQS